MFLTNHHGLGASTVAAVYKERWQIELFFKALKQNLTIKTFVRTSATAVKTQIWTALISMLLLPYLQLTSRFGRSLANLVALLRMNLFTHQDLMAWLDEPFAIPPKPQASPQTILAFGWSWTADGGTNDTFFHNPSKTRVSSGVQVTGSGCFGQQ